MNKNYAFSVIEIMVGLLVVSILLAAFTPIISKKLKLNSVIVEQPNTLTNNCWQTNANNYYHFGDNEGDCTLCSKTACLMCNLEETEGSYIDSVKCKHIGCSDPKDENGIGGYLGANGETCSTCDSTKCTKCADWHGSTSYYDTTNKQCKVCDDGKVCDGVNMTNCSLASYCENGIMLDCHSFNENCQICNSASCTKCANYYYLENGKCNKCISGCVTCTGATTCTKCNSDNYLSDEKTCKWCGNSIEHCWLCSNKNTCTSCLGGYVLTSDNKCTECKLDNCLQCKSGKPDNCNKCIAGYYLNDKYQCAKCIENCAVCTNATECLSCDSGYNYNNETKLCETNDGKFRCSDTNFMKIGKLCYTRFNIGDGGLTNSSYFKDITIVKTNEGYCDPNVNKCCWQGSTSTNCNSLNGDYSGCNRTVCDWNAARQICEQFNYANKIWRLPKSSETDAFLYYTAGAKNNGLMACHEDYSGGMVTDKFSKCNPNSFCKGARSACQADQIWTSNVNSNAEPISYIGINDGRSTTVTFPSAAHGVRCVTEMEE